MTLKSFIKECNEKEVFKKLSIYIVSAWVLIQVLAVTWEPLGLPKISNTYLILALLIGLPLYIFYIWKYQIAPSERERMDSLSEAEKTQVARFRQMYFYALSAVSVFMLIAVAFILQNNFFNRVKLPKKIESDKIAILKFGNNTGDSSNDVVGKMASDWIMHGITQNKLGQVVSPEIVNDYIGVLQDTKQAANSKEIVSNYFKPAKVISGNYFLNNDKLLFQCSITDGNYEETFISFNPVECDKGSPLECIEALKQEILGFLIAENNPSMNLEETPPKFTAYQYFIDAKANFANPEQHLELLNKAIVEDEDYFEPKVLRVAHYYNMGDFKTADSLIKTIDRSPKTSNRQLNLLNTYEALIAGNNKQIYNYTMNEYELAPFDLVTNSGAMVISLQYVNRPREIDSLYKTIPMDGLDITNSPHCQFRMYIQALAQNELGLHVEAIQTISPLTELVDAFFYKRPLIAGYVRSNNIPDLEVMLEKLALGSAAHQLDEAHYFAAREFLLNGNKEMASRYFYKVINASQTKDSTLLAKSYFHLKQYAQAEPLLTSLQLRQSADVNILSKLAVCKYYNKSREEAIDLLKEIEKLRSDYQYGSIDYALAQYYAATEQEDEALQYLLKSIAAGNSYTPMVFQNDPQFRVYQDHPTFKNIMSFWH
ncbi:MAG: hypothetical protein HKN48_02210 [Flavobacteriaceae bacterium]|nr:hypothetical protein [Flavobacteriaceae bacterium]